MNSIQFALGIKNISDLIRKEIQGRWDTEHPTKEQIKKHKRSESEIDIKNDYASNVTRYARSNHNNIFSRKNNFTALCFRLLHQCLFFKSQTCNRNR